MHNEINRGYFATNTVFQSRILSSKESKKKTLYTTRGVCPAVTYGRSRRQRTTKESYRDSNERSWDLYSDIGEYERRKIMGPIRNPGIGTYRRAWKNSDIRKPVNRPWDIKTFFNVRKKIERSGHAWRTNLDLTNDVLIDKPSGKRPPQRWTVQ